MKLRDFIICGLLLSCGVACGSESESPADPPPVEFGGDCTEDDECDDAEFCNGVERCENGTCAPGRPVTCDDGIACTEDSCSEIQQRCLFRAEDVDKDGHAAQSCRGPNNEPLGDDCDDDDPNRYPGNVEVCVPEDPRHDEDCNPATFGNVDADSDGAVSDVCCNVDKGEDFCGTDCDDDNPHRFDGHPEICDELDNDCDDEKDEQAREVFWYPDDDGDLYGRDIDNAQVSCFPIEGHSLWNTDCDDANDSVHPASDEVCDELDNDCDGEIDEENVCGCAVEGDLQACVCPGDRVGRQTCEDKFWSECDCSECEKDDRDCWGVVPRVCHDGRFVEQDACSGARPLCQAGECVCPDGSAGCEDVPDFVGPTVVLSSVADGGKVASDVPLVLVWSEPLLRSSVNSETITLLDAWDRPIPLSYDVAGGTVIIRPLAPLAVGASFQLLAPGGVEDQFGNPQVVSWSVAFEISRPVVQSLSLIPGEWQTLDLGSNSQGEGLLSVVASVGTHPEGVLSVFSWDPSGWVEATTRPCDRFSSAAVDVTESDDLLVVFQQGLNPGNSFGDFAPALLAREQGVWSEEKLGDTYAYAGTPFVIGRGNRALLGSGVQTNDRVSEAYYSEFAYFTRQNSGALNAFPVLVGQNFVAAEDRGGVTVIVRSGRNGALNWQLSTDWSSWTSRQAPAPTNDLPSRLRVSVGPDGGFAFSFTQADFLYVQFVDAAGDALGEPIEFDPVTPVLAYDLAYDEAGQLRLVVFQESAGVTSYIWEDPVFQEELALAPNAEGVLQIELEPRQDGALVAAWLGAESASDVSLRWATYSPGVGWDPVQLIYRSATADQFALEVAATGDIWAAMDTGSDVETVHVVW